MIENQHKADRIAGRVDEHNNPIVQENVETNETPVAETETPAVEETPVAETETLVAETETPAVEETPVAETETPAVEEIPAVETEKSDPVIPEGEQSAYDSKK